MIVMIDNYDSFTYNLVQMMSGLGTQITVFRNDAVTCAQIEELDPTGIVVSPGPCTPHEAGISVEAVRHFSGKRPVLGVCLGHQSMGVAFGATVSNARAIVHGKSARVSYEEGNPLYAGLRNPFVAARYHSLAVMGDTVPAELVPDAWSEDGEIMGMHHREHATFGVQFHPESVLTPQGKRFLRNFLQLCGEID
jgi:anthranilate synthase/aminodeoxychorismate synthase-like glutamine amidotransferase